ncbi:hypothetical protein K456DRAFT_40293 [Colletotrichum gloeosporioides 23]|nr:hypothetical protein K456DRAFT_40293 [Colletotrichum gloeosporioides 23]
MWSSEDHSPPKSPPFYDVESVDDADQYSVIVKRRQLTPGYAETPGRAALCESLAMAVSKACQPSQRRMATAYQSASYPRPKPECGQDTLIVIAPMNLDDSVYPYPTDPILPGCSEILPKQNIVQARLCTAVKFELGWMKAYLFPSCLRTVSQQEAVRKSKGDDELPRHTPDSGPGSTSGSVLDVSSVPETASIQYSVHPPPIHSKRRTFTSASPLVDASSSMPRFVSDLNPESRLLDAENYCEQPQNLSPEIVGIWVQPQPGLGIVQNDFQQDSPWRNHTSSEIGGAADSEVLAFDTIVKLSDIYFNNIQPILPLLNEQDYRQLAKETLPVALAHAVCLVAAKAAAAERHLRLRHAGHIPVSTRQLCSHLHASLISTLHNTKHLRKITVIRIMALLSLHHEGADGAEQASGFVAQAIHSAQSIALHLCRPVDDGY